MSLLLAGAETLDLTSALAHFDEHGYARLGKVATAETLASLRERAEDLMLGRVAYEGLFFQLDAESGRFEDLPFGLGWQGPSLNYRKLEKLEKDPRYLAWMSNPLFERIARARIDGPVLLYRAILFNKSAPGGSEIPWHQDGGRLWGLSRDPELQLWTAIDDAPLNGGCLEVVPGSHKWGLARPMGGIVPPEKLTEALARIRPVPLPADAGELILIHNMLWHRSSRTHHGKPRLGFSACYMSASTKCTRQKRAPREFFEVFG